MVTFSIKKSVSVVEQIILMILLGLLPVTVSLLLSAVHYMEHMLHLLNTVTIMLYCWFLYVIDAGGKKTVLYNCVHQLGNILL